jgi:hypothetical protein
MIGAHFWFQSYANERNETMSYETKVILTLLAQQVGRAKTIKEAYMMIVKAANVEGVTLPSYDQFLQEVADMQE